MSPSTGLVQVLLDNKSHPNSQEDPTVVHRNWDLFFPYLLALHLISKHQETTGWTPLHFAVSKVHLMLGGSSVGDVGVASERRRFYSDL